MTAIDRKGNGGVGSGRSLKEIQSFLIDAISQPLSSEFEFEPNSKYDSKIDSFVKPTSKQTARQRLGIYAKQYWFRLLDSLEEDFPGILKVLGREKFNLLLKGYLIDYPSDSHLLRDLGRYMEEYVREQRDLVEPHYDLVYDLARFEWAQVYAFDGDALPPVTLKEIESLDLEKNVFNLQPYISLMELSYPLDDFKIALKKGRKVNAPSEASSTLREVTDEPVLDSHSIPEAEQVFMVVHRFDNRVFFKRLEKHAFKLLELIATGETVSVACGELICSYPELEDDIEALSSNVRNWFQSWVKLGWLSLASDC